VGSTWAFFWFFSCLFIAIGVSTKHDWYHYGLNTNHSNFCSTTLGDTWRQRKTKNMILQLLLIFSAIAFFLAKFSSNYYWIMFTIGIFSLFQTSISPISDTIVLESLEKTKWTYGPIRIAGAIGYSSVSVLGGIIINQYISELFWLYVIVVAFIVICTLFFPKVKGHQSETLTRVSPLRLFEDKNLVSFLLLTLIVQTTIGFYNTFFPVYLLSLGADKVTLGWSLSIAGMSELPFLFFANGIVKRFSLHAILLFTSAIGVVRWGLLSIFSNPFLIIGTQWMHGLMFIIITYVLANYINQQAPKELKATGQTMSWLVSMGISRIVGSFFGGELAQSFGIKQVFFYNSILCLFTFIIFSYYFARQKRKTQLQEIST
jgi:MFS transporter, PPP family, 3-phenylpropionic acid transporter